MSFFYFFSPFPISETVCSIQQCYCRCCGRRILLAFSFEFFNLSAVQTYLRLFFSLFVFYMLLPYLFIYPFLSHELVFIIGCIYVVKLCGKVDVVDSSRACRENVFFFRFCCLAFSIFLFLNMFMHCSSNAITLYSNCIHCLWEVFGLCYFHQTFKRYFEFFSLVFYVRIFFTVFIFHFCLLSLSLDASTMRRSYMNCAVRIEFNT